jgi:hypothetical protein
MANKIRDWKSLTPIEIGEVIKIEGASGGRRLTLEGITNQRTEVWIGEAPEKGKKEAQKETLIAMVDGDFKLDLFISNDVFLRFGHETGAVFVRNYAKDQIVEKTTDVTFTQIVQKGARNPQLERMMFEMKKNEMAMLAMQNELLEIKRTANAKPSEPTGGNPDPKPVDPPADPPSDPAT